jgi:ribosomal protein S18 acetylase RimI-like enzyme
MAEINWSRAIDPAHPLECIVAADDAGEARGFTLFTELPFTWSARNVCYLLDIFVEPASRGSGHARAMMAHLVSIGRQRGWYKIFWMTEPDNARARRFYDRVARQMNYVRYDLEVSGP